MSVNTWLIFLSFLHNKPEEREKTLKLYTVMFKLKENSQQMQAVRPPSARK